MIINKPRERRPKGVETVRTILAQYSGTIIYLKTAPNQVRTTATATKYVGSEIFSLR